MKINVKDKKKVVVLAGMLALLLCVSAVNTQLSKTQELETSGGYSEYEEQMMNEHDGEVLVDSVNITQISNDGAADQTLSDTDAAGSGEASETETGAGAAVVTSDNIEGIENMDTYFDEVRATINMDRNEIISMLTDVIAEAGEGAEKENATQQKLKIIDYMNKEKVIENLIENKGFPSALVIITDTSINVTVNKAELAQTDIAKITDIVTRETGRSADQIVIQCKSN